MVEKPRLFGRHEPEDLIAQANEEYGPFAYRLCAFSGGDDSLTVAHRCRDHYDALIWCDTGTALPGVREHIEECAKWLDKPLKIYARPDAFEGIVLGRTASDGSKIAGVGMPGYGQHNHCYQQLKQRSFERALRELKAEHDPGNRYARVLMISGIRNAESQRRANRAPITKDGSLVWCNPIIEWSNIDVRDYRVAHDLPQSDVAALIHRSGECNCGAYAHPGERAELKSLWPEWFAKTIAPLEEAAKTAGMKWWKWGHTPDDGTRQKPSPLCADCLTLFEMRADQPQGDQDD